MNQAEAERGMREYQTVTYSNERELAEAVARAWTSYHALTPDQQQPLKPLYEASVAKIRRSPTLCMMLGVAEEIRLIEAEGSK